MKISINDIARANDILFKHLRELEIEFVELRSDYYWDIPKSERYNITAEPTTFTIGQLQSDWDELAKVVLGDREPISYHFVWIAALLRAIGEEIVK